MEKEDVAQLFCCCCLFDKKKKKKGCGVPGGVGVGVGGRLYW